MWKRWGMPPKQVLNPKWLRIWVYGPLMDGSSKQNKDLVFWALILVLKKPKNKSKNLPQIDDPGMQRLSEKKSMKTLGTKVITSIEELPNIDRKP